MDWLILIIYLAGILFTARKIAFFMKKDGEMKDSFDRVTISLMALVSAIFWPIGLIAFIVTGKLPKTDKELKQEVARQKQDIADRDATIARLERDFGINDEDHWSNKQFTL